MRIPDKEAEEGIVLTEEDEASLDSIWDNLPPISEDQEDGE